MAPRNGQSTRKFRRWSSSSTHYGRESEIGHVLSDSIWRRTNVDVVIVVAEMIPHAKIEPGDHLFTDASTTTTQVLVIIDTWLTVTQKCNVIIKKTPSRKQVDADVPDYRIRRRFFYFRPGQRVHTPRPFQKNILFLRPYLWITRADVCVRAKIKNIVKKYWEMIWYIPVNEGSFGVK